MIQEQLLSKLLWIKEEVVKKEANNSQGSYVVDFSGLDPSPGRAPLEKELTKYSAQCCITVSEIVSYSRAGVIVDCKDPYLKDWTQQHTSHKRLHYESGATQASSEG